MASRFSPKQTHNLEAEVNPLLESLAIFKA